LDLRDISNPTKNALGLQIQRAPPAPLKPSIAESGLMAACIELPFAYENIWRIRRVFSMPSNNHQFCLPMKFFHLFVILAAALCLAGCGKKDAADSSGPSGGAAASGGAATTFNGQSFQSLLVIAYLKNFDQYSKDYVAAIGDNSKSAALKARSDALAREQREVVQELKGADEIERFNSIVMGIRKRIEDAINAATQ
jgi:hypothetical protein